MKKYPPIIAGIVLGLLFLMASVTFLFKLAPEPKLPEGTPIAMFMGAVGPTGFMKFVKVFELIAASSSPFRARAISACSCSGRSS